MSQKKIQTKAKMVSVVSDTSE